MKKIVVWLFACLTCCSILEAKSVEIKNLGQLDRMLNQSEGTIYLEVYSPACPACKGLAPAYEKWAAVNISKATFAKVNVRDVRGVIDRYAVRSFPSLLVFNRKTLIQTLVGPQKIRQFMKNNP